MSRKYVSSHIIIGCKNRTLSLAKRISKNFYLYKLVIAYTVKIYYVQRRRATKRN